MELVDVARTLHALPPEDFTAARTARSREARAAGDRELAARIGALRRPTASAWLVNRLVREDPDRVDELLDLGAQMVQAQRTFAGPELRTLGREQHRLLGELRDVLASEGPERGGPWTETVLGQVDATLRAAMADEDAAVAVATGLLTTHLSSTGFEPVTTEGAVAVPDAPSLLGDGPTRGRVASRSGATEAGDADDDAIVTLSGARRTAAPGGSRPTRRSATEEAPARPSRQRRAAIADAERPGTARPGTGRQDTARRGTARQDTARRDAARQDAERRDAARREAERRVAEAAEAVADAEAAAARAHEALDAATRAVQDHAEREADLAREVDDLAERLAAAQAERAAAGVARRRAESERRAAAGDAAKAEGRATRARERLAELRPHE